ncbi:hypothetical protein M2475_001839 [Breznakia sp. PF5-3]|uniref:hypothetical protein n=1 Tax=unclassified Breznakia TaxID=2623764 RepID=UPI0024075A5D|nr:MULTISPECIES: hypothetical protein [unclassified Breznakia]MDF9825384.1 hypothetical protein [Breznakia sp. PM6-1]MDF9836262.1 hypothetical protein [Breznakia sp. PF5-3]MDF9838977.1 hypothetical protein [Breznakia sp. PFB2-8]MDF9860507.1 hypothetical protein [Breznakia sp. PH5-24]
MNSNSTTSSDSENSKNKNKGSNADWKKQTDKMNNHTDKYGDSHDNLDTKGEPNSSTDLYDKNTKELLQRRFYDENGNVIKDIDFKHNDPNNNHIFPHEHYLDWTKNPPRE